MFLTRACSALKEFNILIAWIFYNPSSLDEQLDIIINYDLGANTPELFQVEGVEIPVLGLHQLIVMKKRSGRPQDLLDVEALEKLL